MEKEELLKSLKSISELVGTPKDKLLEKLRDPSKYFEFMSGLNGFISFGNVPYFYLYEDKVKEIISFHLDEEGKAIETVNDEHDLLLKLAEFSERDGGYRNDMSGQFDCIESDRLGISYSNITLTGLYRDLYPVTKLIFEGNIEAAKKYEAFRGTVFFLGKKNASLITESPKYEEIIDAVLDVKKEDYRCRLGKVRRQNKKFFASLEKQEISKQKKLGTMS